MLPELTNREIEVLEQITFGNTNKEISSNLSISESTVENHIHNIYVKLGISNRTQAVAFAFRTKNINMVNNTTENRGKPS